MPGMRPLRFFRGGSLQSGSCPGAAPFVQPHMLIVEVLHGLMHVNSPGCGRDSGTCRRRPDPYSDQFLICRVFLTPVTPLTLRAIFSASATWVALLTQPANSTVPLWVSTSTPSPFMPSSFSNIVLTLVVIHASSIYLPALMRSPLASALTSSSWLRLLSWLVSPSWKACAWPPCSWNSVRLILPSPL